MEEAQRHEARNHRWHAVTDQQFAALAQLLRLRPGPARQVASRVLVRGEPTAAAAKAEGLSYRAAWNSVRRCRNGLYLAQQAAPSQDQS